MDKKTVRPTVSFKYALEGIKVLYQNIEYFVANDSCLQKGNSQNPRDIKKCLKTEHEKNCCVYPPEDTILEVL